MSPFQQPCGGFGQLGEEKQLVVVPAPPRDLMPVYALLVALGAAICIGWLSRVEPTPQERAQAECLRMERAFRDYGTPGVYEGCMTQRGYEP